MTLFRVCTLNNVGSGKNFPVKDSDLSGRVHDGGGVQRPPLTFSFRESVITSQGVTNSKVLQRRCEWTFRSTTTFLTPAPKGALNRPLLWCFGGGCKSWLIYRFIKTNDRSRTQASETLIFEGSGKVSEGSGTLLTENFVDGRNSSARKPFPGCPTQSPLGKLYT